LPSRSWLCDHGQPFARVGPLGSGFTQDWSSEEVVRR
jgi:hypothetical protein